MNWGSTVEEKGQTNFDFVIGVSILVLATVVAFTFMPGLLGSSVDRTQSDEVAAERIVATLAEDRLGDPSRPGHADVECLRALFSSVDACGFDSADLTANAPIRSGGVNVTVLNGTEQVCWDDPDSEFTERSEGTCSTTLTGGDESGGETAVARRPIDIDGYQATIVVRAW